MKRRLPLLMTGNVLFAQAPAGIEREGAYWVETTKASQASGGSVRQLRLTTVGAVLLRGSSGRVVYGAEACASPQRNGRRRACSGRCGCPGRS